MSLEELSLEQYVETLRMKYKGSRIYKFEYDNQFFWLKQPERLTGVQRLLKPDARRAFLHEIHTLKTLLAKGAPVPQLVLFGKDFFVLEDGGESIAHWSQKETLNIEQKNQILLEGAYGLIHLHRQNIVHGRPAIRDMLWNGKQVSFIDFENKVETRSLEGNKIKDSLIFIHSLGREKAISEQQMQWVVKHFQRHCDEKIWQGVANMILKYRWLYYLLLPFKPIARMDLIAIYRVFETLLPLIKHKENQ